MKFQCPTVVLLIRMTSCTLRVIILYFELKSSYFSHQKLACTPQQKALSHSLHWNLYSTGGHTTHWMVCLLDRPMMLITHLRPTLVSPAKHEWRRSCQHTKWVHAHKHASLLMTSWCLHQTFHWCDVVYDRWPL